MIRKGLFLTFSLLTLTGFAMAQGEYFGQNKTRNRSNDFKVLQSTHFDLYYYLKNKQLADDFVRNSEQWYKHHQQIFKMAFITPNPIILYNSHPDFQETTVIGGMIGEGTGGVTEGMKTRVVMPVFYTKKQTDHVLGHELVHVFQYQTMTYGSDSTSLQNLQNIPLFMTEGLAEYMSLGRKDPNTALWMRDAVLKDDIPTIEDLVTKQYKYFPYRWGQVFWAYVTGLYGDEIVRPLYKQTAIYGINQAFVNIFKMDLNSFSNKFKNDLKQYYNNFASGKIKDPQGRMIASGKAGDTEMNIEPAISPDGKYVAYISSKDILSMNIFIADASNGKVVKKINTSGFGTHVDSYSAIESSLSWSPDGYKLALVIQSKSKNKLLVLDPFKGGKNEYSLDKLDAFANPAWSPNGEDIVVTGMVDGTVDLFKYHLKSKELKNLTNDIYSDDQASWSPDGKYLYFITDRGGNDEYLEKENLKIARLTVESGEVQVLDLFENSDVFNPQTTADGKGLYFIASPDGFRDIYKIEFETGKLTRHTNYFSGISGITSYSPALSVAYKSGDVVYNYQNKGEYGVILEPKNEIENRKFEIIAEETGAGIIPPGKIILGENIVQNNLEKRMKASAVTSEKYKQLPYKGKFKLDYLANSGVSMGVSRFGAGMAGGVMALFSDVLNNNQLAGTVALNGEIEDFGGQIYYLNQKNPWQYGFSAGHIPYRMYGGYNLETGDTVGISNGLLYMESELTERIVRLFINQASGFLFKPLSRQTRVEFGASTNWYSYAAKDYKQYGYAGVNGLGYLYDFQPVNYERPQKVDKSELGLENFNTTQIYAALVGDNTTFGAVAPLNGYRYRLEAGKYFGTTDYNQILTDVRKYQYLRPFTLAGRFYYEGRLNPKNIESLNKIYPLYLGYPWYIHGLDKNMFMGFYNQIENNSLVGEQMAVANIELRFPFTGPKKLALIPFNYVASDLNLFIDVGTTWNKKAKINPENQSMVFDDFISRNNPVYSYGASIRINLMGYLLIEPYVAKVFKDKDNQGTVTGVNFMIAGW